jgi:hypothetical protein
MGIREMHAEYYGGDLKERCPVGGSKSRREESLKRAAFMT